MFKIHKVVTHRFCSNLSGEFFEEALRRPWIDNSGRYGKNGDVRRGYLGTPRSEAYLSIHEL
jgi:hypothetical protein